MKLIDITNFDGAYNKMTENLDIGDKDDILVWDGINKVTEWIEKQPRITLDDLRGKTRWIEEVTDYPSWPKAFQCEKCGRFVVDDRFKFCPHCGKKAENNNETD